MLAVAGGGGGFSEGRWGVVRPRNPVPVCGLGLLCGVTSPSTRAVTRLIYVNIMYDLAPLTYDSTNRKRPEIYIGTRNINAKRVQPNHALQVPRKLAEHEPAVCSVLWTKNFPWQCSVIVSC